MPMQGQYNRKPKTRNWPRRLYDWLRAFPRRRAAPPPPLVVRLRPGEQPPPFDLMPGQSAVFEIEIPHPAMTPFDGCPHCRAREFYRGPAGGLAVNVECTGCGARFNLSIHQGRACIEKTQARTAARGTDRAAAGGRN
jgi:hypothetical protein